MNNGRNDGARKENKELWSQKAAYKVREILKDVKRRQLA